MLLLTETWLTDDIRDDEVLSELPNFQLYRNDRASTRGGGVLIAVHEQLSCSVVHIKTELEMLWVLIKARPQSVVLGVCYRPPRASSNFSNQLNQAMCQLTSAHPNAHVLLFGDFNFPQIEWRTSNVHSSTGVGEANAFLDICLNFNMTQLVTEPTRVSQDTASVLDLILTNNPESLSRIHYLPEISDHKTIHATFSFQPLKRETYKKTIHLYDRGDYETINEALSAFFHTFQATLHQHTVDTNWTRFIGKLTELTDKFIPKVSFTSTCNKPWFTKNLKRLENKKKRLFRSAKRAGQPSVWDRYYEADRNYLLALRKAKNFFYNTDLPKLLQTNPRQFWKTLKADKPRDTVLTLESGEAITDGECANLFNASFATVFTDEPSIHSRIPSLGFNCNHDMPAINFCANGILSIIEKMKLSSSAGMDGINSKILKNVKESASLFLALIFSQSLSSGIIPCDWKIGKVVPVFKSGDRNSPLNYRPISLTSVPCKIMEHVIYSHIMNFLDSNNFFHPSQHGFRKGLSCETQLAAFLHDIHTNLDVNVQTDAVFLDYAKAFDKVPHQRLFAKLSQLNLHPTVIKWIIEFLTNRSQRVAVNNHLSTAIPVTSGVPQGSVLGPLLFLIYINDLPLHVTSNIRMFADDCVVYRTILNTSDQLTLENDLTNVSKWCTTWLMTLNVNKCKTMSFTRSNNPLMFPYTINSLPLELTNSYKYLGVTVTSDLIWRTHVQNIISSSNKTLGFLKRHLKSAPMQVRLLAYTSLVRPKLEYASAIWDPHQAYLICALESVQNRAARFIHSSYSYDISVTSLKLLSNLPSLALRRRISSLCLYHKFFHSSILHQPSYIKPATRISARTSHTQQVSLMRARTSTFLASFFSRTAKDWNDLPFSIVDIICPSSFAQHVTDHLLTNNL